MSNSALVNYTKLSPNCTKPRNQAIKIQVDTDAKEVKYIGRTWHGILNTKVLSPDANEDYLVCNGEANQVIGTLLSRMGVTALFSALSSASGITIHNYKMNRYISGYDGIKKMLKEANAKLKMAFSDGYVVVSAVAIHDYSEDEQFDTDLVHFNIQQNFKPINHVICMGKGDLKDRRIIQVYADEEGNISGTQTMTGMDEVCATYDYPNAESDDELIKGGIDIIKKSMASDNIDIDFTSNDESFDIEDIVGAVERITGILVKASIEKKIVSIQNGFTNISYKCGKGTGTVASSGYPSSGDIADRDKLGGQITDNYLRFRGRAADVSTDFNNIITAGIYLLDEEGNDTDARLTIASVNGGIDYIYNQDAVNSYGWIFKTNTWDDVTEARNLLTKGRAHLASLVKSIESLELSAADLATIDFTVTSFHIGTYVNVISNPHGINQRLLVSKISIDLLNPTSNKLTLGGIIQSFTEKTSKVQFIKGEPGKDGKDGEDGKNGIDGKDGKQGEKGDKGDKGDQGLQGVPGANGKDGINGTNGKDGKDAAIQSLVEPPDKSYLWLDISVDPPLMKRYDPDAAKWVVVNDTASIVYDLQQNFDSSIEQTDLQPGLIVRHSFQFRHTDR